MTFDLLSPQSFSIAASLLALIVAFASLAVSWRVAGRDRANLRIEFEYLPMTGLGVSFAVGIVNTGRRPLTIQPAALVDRNGKAFSYDDLTRESAQFDIFLPKTLQETERVDLLFPLWHLKHGSHDPRDYRFAEIRDTTGKRKTVSLMKLVRSIPANDVFAPKDEWE